MPWKTEKRGDEYCVVVSEGPKAGETVKCYPGSDGEAKADNMVSALYANTEYRAKFAEHLARLDTYLRPSS